MAGKTGRTGDGDFDFLKLLDVQAFFEQEGVRLGPPRAKGDWYVDCPFCQAKKKFHISKNGLFKCYKCEVRGNAITFYAQIHNCTNAEAVSVIKNFLGIENGPQIPALKVVRNIQKTSNAENGFRKGDSISLPDAAVHSDNFGGGNGDVTAAIYERLLELTPLLDHHREELRHKRGFNDETIDRLAFRSGGKHLEAIGRQLQAEFDDEALRHAGILIDVNGILALDSQLTDDRILIPYLNEYGRPYHLRPHKLGLKGLSIHPYCRLLLAGDVAGNVREIVLTEGEFKAAALMQWGIPAIAIPGISSFGGKHFERLTELLREFGVRRVVVVFDNEDKSNPRYSNFKEKPVDRYDTQFWSYMMAYKLDRAGYAARVGWLPDEWRGDTGKIDWDGALAAGRTADEARAVIQTAKTPREYLESLPEEALRVVRRKVARAFARTTVHREFNRYVATRTKGGESYDETISNFVVNIKSSFYTPDGVIRNVELVNEYAEKSDVFALKADDMAGLDSFKKFCFSKGNYVFEGNSTDLLNVWKFEFARDVGDMILMPDKVGRVKPDLWLFGNIAIYQGKIFRPDSDGIVWIDGCGYKPQSMQIGPAGEPLEDAIPALYEGEIDIQDIVDKLRQTIGGYEAWVGVGWVIATIFSSDIFHQYRCSPILFAHGMRGSGKSTLLRWLMGFFGVDQDGVGLAETTQNYIARTLSYHSSLGVWFDEYRNDREITRKDGFFRSAYNRQLSGKGTATAFQARGFAVHACVAMSGEETPKDNGLFTRLVPIQISAYRRDRTWYDWLQKNCGKFSAFTLWLILHYDELKPRILQAIAELKTALVKKGISDRMAENWAICAGCFDAVVRQDDDFIRWVEKTCQEIRNTGEQEHMLNMFWSDVAYLMAEKTVDEKYIRVTPEGQIYVWFGGLYEAWAIHYKKKTGKEPFDKGSILKYIVQEPYCVNKSKSARMGGDTRRVIVIQPQDDSPDVLKEIASLSVAPDEDTVF